MNKPNDYHLSEIYKIRAQIEPLQKLIDHHTECHAEQVAAENAKLKKNEGECINCGSKLSDMDLVHAQNRNHDLISCCPERDFKMRKQPSHRFNNSGLHDAN